MEEKIIEAGTFAQVRSHRSDDEEGSFTLAPYQKSEKSAGVLGLMDMMVREIETDMKDAEYEEKTSQADYAKLMQESEESRAANSKGIVTKTASKADVEAKLNQAQDTKTAVDTD